MTTQPAQPPKRPYRFAVIGTGFFAQNHLHAWAEIPEVELVAVCDVDDARVQAAGRDFGGRAVVRNTFLLRRDRRIALSVILKPRLPQQH